MSALIIQNKFKKIDNIKKYIRAANYISAIQIYLKENVLLKDKLSKDNIKPRLLGHWGTAPGINFAYAHINAFLAERWKNNKEQDPNNENAIFLLGPGHGFAALQANLFIEGSLEKYYKLASSDEDGLEYITKNFSWPYGFPSHSSPATPGVIVEGGELGYALSTAYGAVMDNPNMIAFCMVGDGEAETGPTATAWHLNKFLDPKTNGFVLPILHLNGYKISGPSIFGRMTDRELVDLFRGYGYDPIIVEGEDEEDNRIHMDMMNALDESFEMFTNVRKTKHNFEVKFPMIILKTPKGWTGVKNYRGEKIEGNCLSHQVIVPFAKEDTKDTEDLEEWLNSYKFGELFNPEKGFIDDIKSIVPKEGFRMGENEICHGKERKELILPDLKKIAKEIVVGGSESSSMRGAGEYLREVFRLNAENKNFRMFSPDETYSNKLDAVFKETDRAFRRKIESWDKDLAIDGRVVEMLSEHSLQGLLQGYVLTGRHGIFPSYEAFLQIISSMTDQYAKFIKMAKQEKWRHDVSSLNYILTSPGWRQEHNGFSHQNPGFIDTMLHKHGNLAKVYFPVDYNTTLCVLEECLKSKNGINLIVGGKSDEPQWLNINDAKTLVKEGVAVWDFISDKNPDIVFCAAGDYLVKETMSAIQYIKNLNPKIKIRFVNILELSVFCAGQEGVCRMDLERFEKIFTKDKPIIFNFHGYPETLKQVLFEYKNGKRKMIIHGYLEIGSTTTPFDMHVRNLTSRYQIAKDTYNLLAEKEKISIEDRDKVIKDIDKTIAKHKIYIEKEGLDMPEESKWEWKI